MVREHMVMTAVESTALSLEEGERTNDCKKRKTIPN